MQLGKDEAILLDLESLAPTDKGKAATIVDDDSFATPPPFLDFAVPESR